jgi:hypothetical protein
MSLAKQMKKWFLAILMFLASIPVFSQSLKDLKSDMEEARETKRDIFIEMNNGKFLTYEKLKIKAKVLGYEYFEGDGKKLDIPFDSVKSYQTEDYYAVRLDSTPQIHLGKMGARELFGMRIRTGKIELFYSYRQKEKILGVPVVTADNHYSYFLRKGKNSKLVDLSKEALKSMISDNKSVLEEFESMYKGIKRYKSTVEILEAYN